MTATSGSMLATSTPPRLTCAAGVRTIASNMRARVSIAAFLCLASFSTTTGAAPDAGNELRVYLMTFSPGSVIYERFGHNVIVIHDPNPSIERLGERAKLEDKYGTFQRVRPFDTTDRAHHYGAFDFGEGFIPRFVMGRMVYWTASDWADLTALAYARENRAVLLQELNLTPAQKLGLKEFLETNELPENRKYRYDYYRDNCSTRVRDAIDQATDGELKRRDRHDLPVAHPPADLRAGPAGRLVVHGVYVRARASGGRAVVGVGRVLHPGKACGTSAKRHRAGWRGGPKTDFAGRAVALDHDAPADA
jgi:uncharacterized protein DUF4105